MRGAGGVEVVVVAELGVEEAGVAHLVPDVDAVAELGADAGHGEVAGVLPARGAGVGVGAMVARCVLSGARAARRSAR